MPNLLYVNASPRGEQSASGAAADVFLEALDGSVEVSRLDLFDIALPEVTAEVTSAKMKFAMGVELTAEEADQWGAVVELVDAFKAADGYLFALPMWNFAVPYKFKHYIDLITHPGLTFTQGPDGPKGLASGPAVAIYSRGGDYSPKDGVPDPFDFQSTYVQGWSQLVGLTLHPVLVQRTLAGPDAAEQAVQGASAELSALAKSLFSG